ncbi:MAG: hypothetical protein ISR61_11125 [Desulfobacteraceae bacterium]|uniref:GAD domain-containing protein n=1 Tax=Candidatus Desulfacyla euxinica TaxID=2841693 RepID=A0A8J6T725_9DELT|nr:hypothetical protein [Candidatus Desulfacyla euxinica]MBL6979493.1 hypothetical protein [Desulfobacteraceae bacterium]MBL7218332.1 hypothetical protein [Desulfobacteraceae bacterium]
MNKKAILAKGGASSYSRKGLDEISEVVKTAGAKGLAWIKINEEGWQSSLTKFFKEEDIEVLNKRLNAEPS